MRFEKIILNDNSYIPIINLIKFSKNMKNLIISRTELYNFFNNYFLNAKVINKNKCINKKDLFDCKKVIKQKYEETKKLNVKESLKKINHWCCVIEDFIKEENLKIENIEKVNKKDIKISISVYDLIKKENKLVSFQAAYSEYKQVYLIPDKEQGNIDDFKNFLELNYYKIDEMEFIGSLSSKGKYQCNMI